MGPGDPFAPADRLYDAEPDAPKAFTTPSAFAASARRPTMTIWMGLAAGLVFGVLALLGLVLEGLFVLFCGSLGAALAWSIAGIASGRLDVRGAWQALRRG